MGNPNGRPPDSPLHGPRVSLTLRARPDLAAWFDALCRSRGESRGKVFDAIIDELMGQARKRVLEGKEPDPVTEKESKP